MGQPDTARWSDVQTVGKPNQRLHNPTDGSASPFQSINFAWEQLHNSPTGGDLASTMTHDQIRKTGLSVERTCNFGARDVICVHLAKGHLASQELQVISSWGTTGECSK